MSNPTIESSDKPPVKVEVPSELPKVSLVNESLKKLKFHLAQFDSVVKKRTTPNARTEGEWGFEHTKAVFNNEIIPFLKSLKDIFNVFDKDILNEIMEVQTNFDQMEIVVQQSSVDKQCLEIAKKEFLLENDRLLQQIMSQDVLLTVMNSMSVNGESVNVEMQRSESCDKYKSCDNQNALEIPKYFENNDLKAHLQDKDTTICKLKEIIKSLRGNNKEAIVNHDRCELETINKELENSVAKSLLENERLCKEINHVKQVESSKTSDSNTPVLSSTGLKCSTSNCGSKPTGNKKNDRISQTPSRNMKNKVEAQPRKLNKKNRIVEPIFDANVKHSPLNANSELIVLLVVQIVLWYLDFGCSKHMTGNRSQLINFVSKFMGAVRFRNDQIARIIGYGDFQLGNVTISRVYYVEGLGHNLFSVGQFCDADLKVTFQKNTCFIHNLEGVDLLSGSRDTNLYTISLDDILKTSPICLLSKASKTKSWLWHIRLSHLNFGTLNKLAKDGLARDIPWLKFQKDHLCSACALGKSMKSSHQPKAEDTNQEKLYILHMDFCGPMRVASINEKRYILVTVDDYLRFTWVRFLRTKDEAPKAIIKCIKNMQVCLNATIRNVRTDNGTEFVNQTLREFYENDGISHQTSVTRTSQQNGIVERRNRTLIEAARTMLIFSKAPLFLWAKAINTACYTQNCSLICLRYNKTPYELMQDKKLDLSFFHVFGALYYPTNNNVDLGKLDAKDDISIFVGYAPAKKAFRIYNKRTWKIIETIHVTFNELAAMASE
ncbi:retrovirus-related pol polyprotein from transposon TNT 1-94 [Tanacetum coccineum]